MTFDGTNVGSRGPVIENAIGELQRLILASFPEATFDVFERDDPPGVRVRAIVDVEDSDEVLDVVIDALYEYQVEQGLPIIVVPVQPLARVAEQLESRLPHRAPQSLLAVIEP